jgi:ABC-type Fe3+-hydroxamate transport system substrate-binding protein
MKINFLKGLLALMLLALLAMPCVSFSKEAIQEWEMVNPEGVVKLEPMEINPHPSSLEGKTVVLRANGKHNSDNFQARIAELLQKEVKGIKIIKSWEAVPETFRSSQNPDLSKEFAKKIAALKPDLVIGSQCD